jgi:sec-independent protein translocase protein TatA
MGAFSIWHWVIVLVVVLVLFGGGGKISKLMGDFGKGLKFFKKNIKEEEVASDQEDGGPAKAIGSEDALSKAEESPDKQKDHAANR